MFEEDIKKSVEALNKGGTILYPTDTIWGIGCDATNAKAVENVYKIKQRPEAKSMIILICDSRNIRRFVDNVPQVAYDLINTIEQPLTIIYQNAKNLAPNVIGPDGSIAIRVVRKQFTADLIKALGAPIVSSSANISGEPAPILFKEIKSSIKDNVDHVVSLYQDTVESTKASMIVKLENNNEFTILRQ